ncbi:MAG TPA: MFS transporter [Candidatus Acidoferrum sp.]|nr:MFS transporter [Candidatus Acidoferrum sp.]
MAPSTRGFGGSFWALVLATFLGFLGIGTVLPKLAPHVRYTLHGTDQDVGFVVGIFSFVALAGRLIAGPLADRRGRKISFLTGLFCCGLAGAAYLLPLGIVGAYLGRILQGFGEACLYTGAAAWAVEVTGVERSGRALSYLSSGIWGGISCGPVVGQWMGTFERAAAVQLALAAIAFLVITRVREDYHPHDHEHAKGWLPPGILAPGIAIGFVNVHYPVVAGFLVLHMQAFGNSGTTAFSAYALMILLSRFFLGGLPDRIRPSITYFAGLFFMALGLLAIAMAPNRLVGVAAAGLLGFGFSFPWGAVASVVLRRAHPSQRGRAVGVLTAFYDLFVGVSSFAAGSVAHLWGYRAAFLMAAGAIGAAAVAGRFVFAEPAEPSREETELVAEAS